MRVYFNTSTTGNVQNQNIQRDVYLLNPITTFSSPILVVIIIQDSKTHQSRACVKRRKEGRKEERQEGREQEWEGGKAITGRNMHGRIRIWVYEMEVPSIGK